MVLSIIIPVYNCEKYIKRCVDSILSQGYVDLEIILINDGSTDNSGNICEQLKLIDSHIRVFHKTNGGVASARNLGLSKAIGEYIWFVDADDYIDPDSIKYLLRVAEINKLDILQIGYNIVYRNNLKITFRREADSIVLKPKDYINNGFYRGSTWQFIFLKSLLIENHKFDDELILGQDGVFFIKLIVDANRVKRISFRAYNYFQNHDSATHNLSLSGTLMVVSKISRLDLPDYTNVYISTFKMFYLTLAFMSVDYDEVKLYNFIDENGFVVDNLFVKKLFQQLISYRYGFLRVKSSTPKRLETLKRIELFFANYKTKQALPYAIYFIFSLFNVRILDFCLKEISKILKLVYFRKI